MNDKTIKSIRERLKRRGLTLSKAEIEKFESEDLQTEEQITELVERIIQETTKPTIYQTFDNFKDETPNQMVIVSQQDRFNEIAVLAQGFQLDLNNQQLAQIDQQLPEQFTDYEHFLQSVEDAIVQLVEDRTKQLADLRVARMNNLQDRIAKLAQARQSIDLETARSIQTTVKKLNEWDSKRTEQYSQYYRQYATNLQKPSGTSDS